MLHQISMLAVWAMVQPPLATLAATECVAYPESGTIPAEYSCEKFDPAQATAGEPEGSARP
jgi:hypothetical protein